MGRGTRRIAGLSAGLLAAGIAGAPPTAAAAAPAAPKPDVLQAGWHGTSWSAAINLGGRAAKRAPVTASAPCAIGICSGTTTTNAKGRWTMRFDVVLKPGTTTLPVTLASRGKSVARTFTVTKPAGATPGRGTVMVLGDSLAVGTAGVLPPLLPTRPVTTQAAVGRSLAQGMALFGHTPLDARINVVVFSLFTNDDPLGAGKLTAAVRATAARLGPNRCAVWFTIRRPAVNKVSYRAANEALLAVAADPALAGRVIVVPWSEAVDADRALLGKDRVHPTPAGYGTRAQLTADAVGRCAVAPPA